MMNYMKALYNSIKFVSAAILMMAAGACTEEAPEYVKAEVPEGAQAFFKDVPASFDLTDGDGTIEITAYRGNTASDASVTLNSEADAIFSVPSTVNFASGSNSAVISISYDPAKIVPDTPYNFTLTLADNTTPYGLPSCSFSAGSIAPQLWTDFAVATITEGFWGEVHRHTIKYREEGAKRYCIIQADEVCEGGGDGAPCGGGIWGVGVDFEFVWHTDVVDGNGYQLLEVPSQYMGWDYEPGAPVYLYDYYYFFTDNNPQAALEGVSFLDFAQYYGGNYPLGYYDGNGGFFFNLQYMVPSMGPGMGFGADPFDVVAICDGFVRTVDYNADIEYSALYDGESASMMFSEDGVTPLAFEQSLRYDADYAYDPETTTDLIYTTYYLPDYFKEGYGLAFSAPIPEQLAEGAEIKDVANSQNTGLVMFGNPLTVNVKMGSVSFPAGGEFPVFNFRVAVYSLDGDGEKTYDFGMFDDVYTAVAYGRDNYIADDIVGLNKESYLGVFNIKFNDFYNAGAEAVSQILIEDAGATEEGVELLAIRNLSGFYGYNDTFDDVVYAEWDSQGGFVFLTGQTLENPLNDGTSDYPIDMLVMDPYAGKISSEIPLVLGYVQEDDVLAFVAYPGYETFTGVYFANDALGALGAYYNIVASWPETQSASFSSVPAMIERRPDIQTMVKPMSVSERRINSSNAVPYERPAKNISSVEKINVELF